RPVRGRRQRAPTRVPRLPGRHPARLLARRQRHRADHRPPRRRPAPDRMSAPSTSDLFRTENLRRRRAVNRLVELGAVAPAFLAVGILVIVVASVAKRGAGAISIDFLTKTPSPSLLIGETTESGIANAIVGTAIIIGLAVLMALPVGVLAAIYLNALAA